MHSDKICILTLSQLPLLLGAASTRRNHISPGHHRHPASQGSRDIPLCLPGQYVSTNLPSGEATRSLLCLYSQRPLLSSA